MRLALDPRARRLLRRVPRSTVYSAMELVLLSLLAMQCARLAWTVVTPVDPVGNWRADSALHPALPATSLLGEFDPFFRLSGESGAVVVTSLDLKLFGVREDRASGKGSAIIGTPDGLQRSYAVGDEIVPGVTLTAVSFDGVTISRGGVQEQLFLDQSTPAEMAAPAGTAGATSTTGATGTPAIPESSGMDRSSPETPENQPPELNFAPTPTPAPTRAKPPAPSTGPATNEIQFQPRLNGGQVSGLTVQPRGSGNAFRAAGLAPGDVILSVGGRRVTSAEQARTLASQFSGQKEVVIEVERAGRVIPLRVGSAR